MNNWRRGKSLETTEKKVEDNILTTLVAQYLKLSTLPSWFVRIVNGYIEWGIEKKARADT